MLFITLLMIQEIRERWKDRWETGEMLLERKGKGGKDT